VTARHASQARELHPARGQVSVNLYSHVFDGPAADAVRRLADQGFARFELMMFPGHLWTGDQAGHRDLLRTVEQADVTLTSLNMPNIDINIAAASGEMQAFSLNLLISFIEVAGGLGVTRIVLSPGKPNPLFPAPVDVLRDALFAALDRLLPYGQRNGVQLLLENVPFGTYPDCVSLMRVIDEFGAAEIGVTYDAANAHFIGEDPAEALRVVAPRMGLLHLSDTTRASFRHDPVGAGDVPFDRLLQVIREVGSGDKLVLEVVSSQPDVEIAESVQRLAGLGYFGEA
jgi:L-ribulose-5-phosphate 3-epimerase